MKNNLEDRTDNFLFYCFEKIIISIGTHGCVVMIFGYDVFDVNMTKPLFYLILGRSSDQ